MPAQHIFVASTIDINLGGIARSVPALAAGVGARDNGQGPRVVLIAPRAAADTLGSINGMERVDVRLCDGFDGVKQELETAVSEPAPAASGAKPLTSYLYHAGVWNSLNHYVAQLGRRTGIPVIVSTRSMLDPWALNHRKWKKRLAWWLYAKGDLLRATAIHATAELEAGYIRKALGPNCPPVIVVPNGVFVGPGTRDEGQGTRDEGVKTVPIPRPLSLVPCPKKRLLFLSRIHQKKGVPDLIKAFGELDTKDWELVIAGNDDPSAGSGQAGGHLKECEQLAKAQPNGERISFPGPVSDADKWDLYASADIFVLPSYSENFGIVVGEALGSGVPVITTTETPWGEYVGRVTSDEGRGSIGKGLLIVEPGVPSLVGALKEVMALSDEERNEMGARGAEWIRREFTWKAIGMRFLEEVEKVLPEID